MEPESKKYWDHLIVSPRPTKHTFGSSSFRNRESPHFGLRNSVTISDHLKLHHQQWPHHNTGKEKEKEERENHRVFRVSDQNVPSDSST